MSSYWAQRKELLYYKKVLEFARNYCPLGGALLDVGGGQNCEYLAWFDWFERKEIVDIIPTTPVSGVKATTMDFMKYAPNTSFDLVLCLQVLEHLEQPKEFCRKLFTHGKTVIISVPYMWPIGRCKFHLQDPVDEAKLSLWAGIPWKEMMIVHDAKSSRMIAVYQP